MRIPAILLSTVVLVAGAPALAQKAAPHRATNDARAARTTAAPTAPARTPATDARTATYDDGEMVHTGPAIAPPHEMTDEFATIPPPGGDVQLEAQIESRLASIRGLDLSDVHIHAMRGAITLRGTVPDNRTRERILVATNGLDGVSVVRDEMSLRSPAETAARGGGPVDDGQLARSAQQVVARDQGVVGRPLAVDSRGGVVTLRGHVATWNDAHRVIDSVRAVPGVRGVRSDLVVNENVVVDVNARRILRAPRGR